MTWFSSGFRSYTGVHAITEADPGAPCPCIQRVIKVNAYLEKTGKVPWSEYMCLWHGYRVESIVQWEKGCERLVGNGVDLL